MPSVQQQICHACSLSVQPGYPCCPRCKEKIPASESNWTTNVNVKNTGTFIPKPTLSGWPLYLSGAAFVVTGIILIFFRSHREQSTVDSLHSVRQEEIYVAPQTPQTPPRRQPPSLASTSAEEQEDAIRLDRQHLLIEELKQSLDHARLWATIDLDIEEFPSDATPDPGPTLSIISGSCEDKSMQPTLRKALPGLRDAGFSRLLCVAKHGALLFEIPL